MGFGYLPQVTSHMGAVLPTEPSHRSQFVVFKEPINSQQNKANTSQKQGLGGRGRGQENLKQSHPGYLLSSGHQACHHLPADLPEEDLVVPFFQKPLKKEGGEMLASQSPWGGQSDRVEQAQHPPQ